MGRPPRDRPDRVEKPYPEFPLTPHPNGQWCKSIKGRVYYFGHWENWQEALAIYTARRADIEAGLLSSTRVTMDGQAPGQPQQGITVVELVNHFLTVKEQAVQAGTLSPRTFVEYDLVAGQMVRYFGRIRAVATLQPVDFIGFKNALGQGKTRRISLERLGKLITIARLIFSYGAKNGLHPPVLFGTEFFKPKAEQLRRLKAKLHREGRSKKLFTSQEVRDLLDAADGQMRAMILLALNGGLGNNDIALLPFIAIDLQKSIVDYPRPKTGLDRRIPLSPERRCSLKPDARSRFSRRAIGSEAAFGRCVIRPPAYRSNLGPNSFMGNRRRRGISSARQECSPTIFRSSIFTVEKVA